MVKNLPAKQETRIRSPGWENPLEKRMAITPVFLPGESHGQRSLASYRPRDYKESDTTEQRRRRRRRRRRLLSPTLVVLLVNLGRLPTQAQYWTADQEVPVIRGFQSCPLTSGKIYELLVQKAAYHSSIPTLRILPDLALCTSSSGCSSVFFIISFTIN